MGGESLMPDWGKWGDALYDGAGNLVDKGKEIVGTGIDKGTDVLGSGLEKVGADEWADKVEDWGDETASSLGAEVREQQLGQTEEADELIHGRPEKISAAVKNLRDFQKAFDLVGGGMKKLDSGHWKGEAADAFRAKFQTLPTDWVRAADAFEDAAKALETFAGTVTSAQAKAAEAIALFREGKQDYETAAAAFKEKAEAYNAVRNTDHPLPHPGTFSDPGAAKRRHAQEILQRARQARDDAAETAKGAITAAMAHAPKEPTGMDRAKQELIDYGVGQGMELAHFGGGVIKGTAGLVNFVRSVNPQDPYNLTHPAEYYKGVNMTLAGLTSTVANPDRALKNAWDAAKGDPSEFLGRLVPELIGTKGGGLIKSGLRAGMKDLPKRPKGPHRQGHERNPDSNGQQCSKVKCAGDPVDVATGRMLLPQTDIVLPGSLPLVFERVFDSSHRAAAGSVPAGRARSTNAWRSMRKAWCSAATKAACSPIRTRPLASPSCPPTAGAGPWTGLPTATPSPTPRQARSGTSSTSPPGSWRSWPRSTTVTAAGSPSSTTRRALRRRSCTTAATT